MSHAAHPTQTPPPHKAAHGNPGWNPDDPHGDETHHHGHIVVGWKLQLGVLAALLFFTALTVAFYNLEQWAEVAFGIHLPGWINIVGAMSIAAAKATLVCMFFMQLRYDKPLNTFILLFCLVAVGLFVFFSMIDLGARGWVNEFKSGELLSGGTGVGLGSPPRDETFDARVSPRIQTGNLPIGEFRRNEAIAAYLAEHPGFTEIDWWAAHYAHHHEHRNIHDTENYYAQLGYTHGVDPEISTADRSVHRHGLSGALELAEPAGPAEVHQENGH